MLLVFKDKGLGLEAGLGGRLGAYACRSMTMQGSYEKENQFSKYFKCLNNYSKKLNSVASRGGRLWA